MNMLLAAHATNQAQQDCQLSAYRDSNMHFMGKTLVTSLGKTRQQLKDR